MSINSTALVVLKHTANVLVFGATVLYIAIIFGGLSISSHIYHDIHKLFKIVLSIGLIVTSAYDCSATAGSGEKAKYLALHCKVSSKFSLIAGLLLLISALVDLSSPRLDANRDGLLSYSDFSGYVDSITGSSLSEKLKSNLFDLLGGDNSDRIYVGVLPSMFFPLA